MISGDTKVMMFIAFWWVYFAYLSHNLPTRIIMGLLLALWVTQYLQA